MKRKKYLILVAGLILTFLFCLGANGGQILTSLSSAGPVDLSLVENSQDTIVKVETKEGKPGEELKVPITIQNAIGMAGAQFDLSYKSEVAVATAVEKGELVKDFFLIANLDEAKNGLVKIALAGSEGVNGNGTLVVVTFKLSDKDGNTYVDLKDVELNDENGDITKPKTINGKIEIKAAPKPIVKSTIPVNDATNVAIDAPVSATFDLGIELKNPDGVTIKDAVYGNPVSGVKATLAKDNNKTLDITHDKFNYLTKYIVTIQSNSVQSVVYKTYNDEYSWIFTTVSPKPIVESTIPVKDAKNVPINTELSATFDQDISVAQAAYIKINNQPVKIEDVTAADKKLTIKHDDFALNTSYMVEIGAGSVQSVVYKTYNDTYKWNFTTGAKMVYPLEIESFVAKDADGNIVTTCKAGVMYNFEALLKGTLSPEINENERNILYIVQLKDNNNTYYNIGSFAKKKVNVVDETLGAGFKVPNTPGEYIVEAFVWNKWPSEVGTQRIWAEKKEIKITVGQ
ncbi:MAG: hypothetical protein STSR0004_19970 [Peptococcaceae bacterium]